jgi:integrase
MIEDFERFLKKVKKKNGDKLLPVTIEKYLYFVKSYIDRFEPLQDDKDKLISLMNSIVSIRPSIVIYSSFRMYLIFLGIDQKSDEIKKLKSPPKSANSFTSKRFLQSKVLSRGELKRLFIEVDDETRLIFSFLYDTACRRKELLNITWGDFVFKNERQAEDDKIYAEVNILGKGAKSRVVYIGKVTHDLLMSIKKIGEKKEKVFVFYKDNEKKIPYEGQEQQLYYLIINSCKKILGRHITPHAFRHTKLTHLADSGADVLGISRYAGHENIATSQIYIEISSHVGRMTFSQFSQDIIDEEVVA